MGNTVAPDRDRGAANQSRVTSGTDARHQYCDGLCPRPSPEVISGRSKSVDFVFSQSGLVSRSGCIFRFTPRTQVCGAPSFNWPRQARSNIKRVHTASIPAPTQATQAGQRPHANPLIAPKRLSFSSRIASVRLLARRRHRTATDCSNPGIAGEGFRKSKIRRGPLAIAHKTRPAAGRTISTLVN